MYHISAQMLDSIEHLWIFYSVIRTFHVYINTYTYILIDKNWFLNNKTVSSVVSGKPKQQQLPDFMDISIFLISPYRTAASQDKAISQNVINTAASHRDIARMSDLLHPQKLPFLLLDRILDLCRLWCNDSTCYQGLCYGRTLHYTIIHSGYISYLTVILIYI